MVPTPQNRATLKRKEEDLMSFDAAPKEIKPTVEETYISERRRQKGVMDMPEEQHESLSSYDAGFQHPVEMSDDEESHGITMVDNEDEGITMLEPIPWTEDEELRTIESPQPTKRKEDTRQETAQARMQDAWDKLDLGK